MSAEWGYDSENGPHTWHKKFPTAAGHRQSPVDIQPKISKVVLSPQNLTWEYCEIEENRENLTNTGHSWKVSVSCGIEKSKLYGGPLEGVYVLEQFHCHWGKTNSEGSEHTIGGKTFAGELHLVHWNSTKYKSFADAATHSDGLCVLGVFLTPGKTHCELDKIVQRIHKIEYKNDKIPLSCSFNPTNYLPENSGYYTYLGSLTTPPCTECVVWIVFKEPIEVSEEQLTAFRHMKSYAKQESHPKDEFKGFMKCNFRPTLPLGHREIREC